MMPVNKLYTSGSGEHWRKGADAARSLADDMKDEISKQMMLQIADDYERLAKRAGQTEPTQGSTLGLPGKLIRRRPQRLAVAGMVSLATGTAERRASHLGSCICKSSEQTGNLPGKLATPLDNVDRADRKAEVRAELAKRLDVKRPDIRARGHY